MLLWHLEWVSVIDGARQLVTTRRHDVGATKNCVDDPGRRSASRKVVGPFGQAIGLAGPGRPIPIRRDVWLAHMTIAPLAG